MSAPSAHSWTEETTKIESRGKLPLFFRIYKNSLFQKAVVSVQSVYTLILALCLLAIFNHCHKM